MAITAMGNDEANAAEIVKRWNERDTLRAQLTAERAAKAELVAALEQTVFALELIIAPYAELPDAHISDSTRAARVVSERSRAALTRAKESTP